jgi:3'(2'), 5'-bisphosphate nucleotidase
MLEQELEAALRLAKDAGKTLLDFYKKGVVTEEKIGVDLLSEPVTEADRAASRLITGGLKEAFPRDGILSEEEPDDFERRMRKERVWIIDPMDGTAGFVKGDGDFAVQIGLSIGGLAMLGVVLMPYYGIMTYAVKGQGAFVVTEAGDPVKMTVSDKRELHDLCLAASRNHFTKRMERIMEHFRFRGTARRGSVGLKVALIAQQECDVYIHPSPRTKLWDTCAPQIILEEAGGRFTDIFGADFRYDVPDLQNHNGIVASNGVSHTAVIDHLRPLLHEFGRTPYAASA